MHAKKKMEKCLEQHREIIEKMQQKEMIWAFVPWNNVSILFREGCCLAKGMLNRMKWLRLAPSLQLDLGSRNEILEGPLMFSSNAWRKDLDDYPEQNLVAHWVLSNLHTKSFLSLSRLSDHLSVSKKIKFWEHLGVLSVGSLLCSCYNSWIPGSATSLSHEIPGRWSAALTVHALCEYSLWRSEFGYKNAKILTSSFWDAKCIKTSGWLKRHCPREHILGIKVMYLNILWGSESMLLGYFMFLSWD